MTTQTAKHTPGPWKALVNQGHPSDFISVEINGEDVKIAEAHSYGWAEKGIVPRTSGAPSREERHANARLIAAAPEMYEALAKMREAQQEKAAAWKVEPVHGRRSDAIQRARNTEARAHEMILLALAKAEGRVAS